MDGFSIPIQKKYKNYTAISGTMCSTVFMGNTKHITVRMPEELVLKIQDKATAENRSRSQVVVLALMDHMGLESVKDETKGESSNIEMRSDSDTRNSNRERLPSDLDSNGNRKSKPERKRISLPDIEHSSAPPFRGSGKCPHGYMSWMTCRNANGGCQ